MNNKKFTKALRGICLLVLIAISLYEIIMVEPGEIADPQPVESTAAAPKELKITMIDVGQGDSILLSYGDDHALIDTNMPEFCANVDKVLDENGVGKLDYLIATHPHADHIGYMADVLEKYGTEQYYYTDCDTGKYTYKRAMEFANEYADSVELITTGDEFYLGGDVKLSVLSPDKGFTNDSVNNYSAVLLLEYGDFNALLMGDLESDIEKQLVKDGVIPDVDLLKVGHHGSYTSSNKNFLKACKPEISLISLGEGNEYGYPHQTTLDKLKEIGTKVYRTDLDGTVVVTVDDDGEITVG